jgi:hypothetical protein
VVCGCRFVECRVLNRIDCFLFFNIPFRDSACAFSQAFSPSLFKGKNPPIKLLIVNFSLEIDNIAENIEYNSLASFKRQGRTFQMHL